MVVIVFVAHILGRFFEDLTPPGRFLRSRGDPGELCHSGPRDYRAGPRRGVAASQCAGAGLFPADPQFCFYRRSHRFCGDDSDSSENLLSKALDVVVKTLRHPLTIVIILGVLVSLLSIPVPAVLFDALTYLRRLALPLALIGIGGSMGAYRKGGHYPLALGSSALKLFLLPVLTLVIGRSFGLTGEELSILAIFAGVPTAVTSYAMADHLGGDRDTAGSIVLVSTAACFLTLPLILAALSLPAF